MGSAGPEAVELAKSAGLILDPWQEFSLEVTLSERADGKWAAFETGEIVPRQNGKGAIIEAIELAAMVLFDDDLILHTAHEFKTAQEGFRRVLFLVENCEDLYQLVLRVRSSHGEEGIELRNGRRLRFVARSTGSGRGFSAPRLILDEAYALTAEQVAAILPTMSAQPNPQVHYFSSAGMAHSTLLHALRRRAMEGVPARLAYLEWSVPAGTDHGDTAGWAQANPALGYRLTGEFIEAERDAMSGAPVEFGRERLGIWDEEGVISPLDPADWEACADKAVGEFDWEPWTFSVHVPFGRKHATVAACGPRKDGKLHVEIVKHGADTEWVADFLICQIARWKPRRVAYNIKVVGDLHDELLQAGARLPKAVAKLVKRDTDGGILHWVDSTESVAGCAALFDAVSERKFRHSAQPSLDSAVSGAVQRPFGDGWSWDWRKSQGDISPLVAATQAYFAAVQMRDVRQARSRVVNLNDVELDDQNGV